MTKMAGALTMAIVEAFGPAEMLRRLSDPWWFQAFGWRFPRASATGH
jgi:hypothetical protein